jgi:hypothetical protein
VRKRARGGRMTFTFGILRRNYPSKAQEEAKRQFPAGTRWPHELRNAKADQLLVDQSNGATESRTRWRVLACTSQEVLAAQGETFVCLSQIAITAPRLAQSRGQQSTENLFSSDHAWQFNFIHQGPAARSSNHRCAAYRR